MWYPPPWLTFTRRRKDGTMRSSRKETSQAHPSHTHLLSSVSPLHAACLQDIEPFPSRAPRQPHVLPISLERPQDILEEHHTLRRLGGRQPRHLPSSLHIRVRLRPRQRFSGRPGSTPPIPLHHTFMTIGTMPQTTSLLPSRPGAPRHMLVKLASRFCHSHTFRTRTEHSRPRCLSG